ncbi:MAG: hypothetical protein PVH29_02280 [Candidatus Zixiibacteriota bacterium]|jgi:hypothetical protein
MSRDCLKWTTTATLVAAACLVAGGCADLYYRDWPPSYRHELMHLGEVSHEVDARAVGMAGAGRASTYGAGAAISNPAALASLTGSAASGGVGYRNWGYSVQPSQAGTNAQSFFGSFAGAYAAGAWSAVPGRVALGGALWTPSDYTYEIGGDGTGGEVKSRGSMRALGPAAAFRLPGVSLGVAADFLWARETVTLSNSRYDDVDVRGTGYDLRASLWRDFDLGPGWRLAVAAVGKKGGDVRFRDGSDYEVQFAPTVGGALSLQALSINVHLDYLYTFYEDMEFSNGYDPTPYVRDVGWAYAGAEYVLDSGAVARTGVSYRPWYVSSGRPGSVDALFYGIGGGWPVWSRHGRFDVGLGYGRRGALDADGYSADIVDFKVGLNYFW